MGEFKYHFRANHFKVGGWYAVDEYLGGPTTTPWGQEVHPDPDFDGTPVRILSISMPFIAVTNGKQTFSLDTRQWGVVELSPPYVKHMMANLKIRKSQEKHINVRTKRKKKRKPDIRDCPRCGERRRQRLIGQGMWKMICPNCGWDGELGDGVPE